MNLPEKKRGYLDLFWKGKLLVEQKSAGRSLMPARRQALDYFPGLKEHELPRYILLSDFQNFELRFGDAGNRGLVADELNEKLIKIGAKVVSRGRYVAFQMAELAIPRNLFADILRLIAELRPPPVTSTA